MAASRVVGTILRVGSAGNGLDRAGAMRPYFCIEESEAISRLKLYTELSTLDPTRRFAYTPSVGIPPSLHGLTPSRPLHYPT